MFAIFVLFVISLADLTLQAEWTYNLCKSKKKWGLVMSTTYPTNTAITLELSLKEYQWPGVCNVGKQQSPINIMTNEAVVDTHQVHIRGPLVFRGYNDVPLYAVNNGHTLKWSGVTDGPAPILQGGPLRGNYTFLQFHFHWLSEHAIDGMKYPLEVHMVHIKTGLTLDEALLRSDGLAVVGVMFMVRNGYDSGRALEEIIPMVPYLGDSSQNKTEVQRIDVSRLLSHQPQSYYTYHGSLTTPMCQEVVTWIVMDKPVYITPEQYKMFTKVDVGGDFNYRSLQHPNGRVVYRSIASCASILLPTVPGTLLSLLSCLSTTLAAGVNKGIGTVLNVKRKIFGDTAKKCIKLN